MQDIAPELLEKIKAAFEKETAELKKTIENGVRSYEEAYGHAITAGEALAKSFRNNITAEALPDGKMYYNIADRVVRPMLKEEYNLVSEAAVLAQASANKSAKIGLNPQKADFDEDRAYGIVNRVSSQPYDEIKWILDEPVKSFSKSVVDQTIQTNIDFQGKSGLSPKIVRTPTAGACAWCLAVAGTYSYPNVPSDVYRRHANCDCIVEYVNAGKIQNVHSKKIYSSKAERDAAVQERIARAQERIEKLARQRIAKMPPDEYARAKELWYTVKELDLPQKEKEYVFEEFDNNLTAEEKESAVVNRPIGNYWYRAVNLGHNQYKIYAKDMIDRPQDVVDEVLSEMFGSNWRELLDE